MTIEISIAADGKRVELEVEDHNTIALLVSNRIHAGRAKLVDPPDQSRRIKDLIDNVVCAARGNDAQGAYNYGAKVAEAIIKIKEE